MLSEKVECRAMLIHHHKETKRLDITSHAVIPLDGGKNFTLGAGRAFSSLDKEVLIDLLREEEPNCEFIPPNLLVKGRNRLVWYTAPQVIEVPFNNELIKAPIPGLVYIAGNGSFRCFSYKGKARPTAETELFYAPFGNTYANGSFCSGNVKLPREILIENIPVWQRFVLESTNTHAGGVIPLTKIKDFSELVQFYRTLASKNARKFPDQRLKAALANHDHLTLKAAIGGEA
ncbi:PRTRC system protein B [Pseudomonas sp. NY15437]|uniref:PRTRC system protein B n=1 Tax=Pseudomonas sp. NY15437 TaxID=3400360 RepID=UPI003A86CE40